MVGLADLRQQLFARGAGLDRDEADARLGQLGAHRVREAREAVEHLQRRAALGQVVVARIHHHVARLVAHHQVAREEGAVGQGGAPEAAVDDAAGHLLGEVLRQAGPHPHRGTADEHHAARRRKALLVGAREGGELVVPAALGGQVVAGGGSLGGGRLGFLGKEAGLSAGGQRGGQQSDRGERGFHRMHRKDGKECGRRRMGDFPLRRPSSRAR